MAIADIAIQIVTKGADLAKNQLNKLGGSAGKSGKMMSKLATAGKVAGIAIGVALVKGMTKATQEFIAFNDKMTQSIAIMDTTIEQQKAMEAQAIAVSRETRISAEQSAEAFFFLASAGLNAEQSISALPQVAKFAQAGMFDMATATDLATDAQSALGLTVDDAQQNLDNLTKVTDVLVKANTLANSSVQQFSEALTNKAGSALKVANKGIEEGVAVLSAFADRGVKGAEAGEKLNQLLRDIPRATAKNSEEFKKLGLNMFDTEGNMKNVADIIEELDSVLAPMSDELKASTLDQLGLNRGVADAVKILSGAGDEIRNYEQALMESGGTTEEVADKQMGSLKAQLDIMSNAFSELGILLGETIAPILVSIVGKVTDIVQGFSDFIKNQKEVQSEIRKNVQEAEDLNEIYGTKLPRAYSLYNSEVKNNEELMKDSRTATERAIDVGMALHRQQNKRVTTEDIISEALANHTRESEKNTEAMEEATEQAKEYAENIQKNMLPSLDAVISAQNKLKDIQERVRDAEEDRDEASKEVTKSQEKLEIASQKVLDAEEALFRAKEEAKLVTDKEKLAILQQEEAIRKLEESEEKNEIQELQLAIAKEKLTELIEASTGATREQETAERNLLQAQEEEERALERLTKAQDKLTKAQKELNEVTAKTPENLLEIAMAKKELDEALKNLDALGSFDEAMGFLVESTGMKLQDLIDMANAIKSGEDIAITSLGGASSSVKTGTDGVEVGEDIVSPTAPSGRAGSGMEALQRAGAVVITQNINVEGKDANAQALDIIDALNRAKRNGQRVVF
jgi:TP901 family phage tail tape measure protein